MGSFSQKGVVSLVPGAAERGDRRLWLLFFYDESANDSASCIHELNSAACKLDVSPIGEPNFFVVCAFLDACAAPRAATMDYTSLLCDCAVRPESSVAAPNSKLRPAIVRASCSFSEARVRGGHDADSFSFSCCGVWHIYLAFGAKEAGRG